MPHDDFAFEPVRGLPGPLPRGETILWQGRPVALRLARDALALDWVLGYFALLVLWRVGASLADYPPGQALGHAVPFLALGLLASVLILGVAWAQARATVYTITTSRVTMRIGAALELTLNLPFPQIAAADLRLHRDGTGTVALTTLGSARLGYAVLWPHIRPWHVKRPRPALRAIPDAERVAALLADAAEARLAQPAIAPRIAAMAAE